MNIDGVSVLSQEVIMETPDFAFIVAGFITVCTFLFVIWAFISDDYWPFVAYIISGIVLGLWLIVGVCGIFDRPSSRYTYKCIIDETVLFQEVYDKYEVIGKDGEVWILEDKK